VIPRRRGTSVRPSLPRDFCRSLNRECRAALPPWVRARVVPKPGGYDVRGWNLHPSSLSFGHGAARGIDTPDDLETAAREAMTRVQHIVGRSLGVAWPSSTPLEPRPSRSSGMGSAEMIRAWLGQFPEAHARLEGTDLATWFGPPGHSKPGYPRLEHLVSWPRRRRGAPALAGPGTTRPSSGTVRSQPTLSPLGVSFKRSADVPPAWPSPLHGCAEGTNARWAETSHRARRVVCPRFAHLRRSERMTRDWIPLN
jgi:hypothetical protein